MLMPSLLFWMIPLLDTCHVNSQEWPFTLFSMVVALPMKLLEGGNFLVSPIKALLFSAYILFGENQLW